MKLNKNIIKKEIEHFKFADIKHVGLVKKYLNNRQISDILINSLTSRRELAEFCVFGLNRNKKHDKLMIKKYKICKNNGIDDIWIILKVCCENFISIETEFLKNNLNARLKIKIFKTNQGVVIQ